MPRPKATRKKKARPKAAKVRRKPSRKVPGKARTAGKPGPSRIAIISDTHSNMEALEAVFRHIRKQKGVLKVMCAGDVIGYGPNPNECCEAIRKLDIPVAQGNHDLNIDLRNIGWFNRDAQAALAWTSGEITQKNRNWLLGLPMVHKERLQGVTIYMVHGSPEDPHYEYTTEETPKYVMKHWLDETGSDVIVVGHTHRPFIRRIGGKLVINAGSVSQPRDGDPRACYVLLDLKEMKAEIVRVPYNIDLHAEKIRRIAALPGSLADRLYDGV